MALLKKGQNAQKQLFLPTMCGGRDLHDRKMDGVFLVKLPYFQWTHK